MTQEMVGFWDGRWQWHQLDNMQTICTSLQTDKHTNTSLLNIYRPYALHGAKLQGWGQAAGYQPRPQAGG